MLGWFVNTWSHLIHMDMVYTRPMIKFGDDEMIPVSRCVWYIGYESFITRTVVMLLYLEDRLILDIPQFHSQYGQHLLPVVYQFLLPPDYQTIVNSYVRS